MKDCKSCIPKIIHQTWKTSEVPEKWKSSPESIKRLMPEWQWSLTTDQDNREIVKKYFPDFLVYYDAFPYDIQRADAVRYVLMWAHGGVYLDLDMELLKPLDELVTRECNDKDLYFVLGGNSWSGITNCFMASKPYHPIWKEVIEEMKKPLPWWSVGKHLQVMMSTGPIMLNSVVKRSRYPFTLLPKTLIMPCSICVAICNKPDAYVKPLEGGSWIEFDTTLYNILLCNWVAILILIIVVIVIIIYFTFR